MLFPHRLHHVTDVETLEELARKVAGDAAMTWTLCQAFRCEGLLFLNDSTGAADGAQEYAVYATIAPGDWCQLESLTVSWMTPERFVSVVQEILTELQGEHFTDILMKVAPERLRLDFSEQRCPLCA